MKHETDAGQPNQNPQSAGAKESAMQPGSHAPGDNRLNDIADKDIDKVVPRDSKETALHDHARGDTDERDTPDESGEIPRPL